MGSEIVADERTYAERFGSKASARALILHVGDVGITGDSDLRVIEAIEKGWLWEHVQQVLENATSDEVAIENRAQIDRAWTMEFELTRMDSCMGVLFR